MQIERSAYFIASTITLWNLYWIVDKELDNPSFCKNISYGFKVSMIGIITYSILTPTLY
jgi:hypothetical protein